MKVSANTIPVPMAAVMKRRRRHCRSRNAVINIRMRAGSRSSHSKERRRLFGGGEIWDRVFNSL
jgi:hypothetical protein